MQLTIEDGHRLPKPFADATWTARGERRAVVPLKRLETVWFNTGTLCNIDCANCYIESSPRNDRLSYLTLGDVLPFLDEITGLPHACFLDRVHRRRTLHEPRLHRHT